MATHRLGLIMHGVTGRMGLNQHLIRSIVAIRRDGGVTLSNGDRVMPDPILVGRNAEKVSALAKTYDIPRWTTIPSPYTEGDARDFIGRSDVDRRAGRELSLAIVDVTDGDLLGGCGLAHFDWDERRAEVGYWVARAARRRSVGTRAVRLLSRWALDSLGIERLELLTDPRNEASMRLAARAGFTQEGLLRGYRRRGLGRWDLVMHSLLAEER
jgi:RimJ/RimL family protein N-acetyltransferase